jgi:hypothetical protein
MNTTTNDHTGTASREHRRRRHHAGRVLAAAAVGLAALSIALATPAAAKGHHPGHTMNHHKPTSSVTAQHNAATSSTRPATSTGRPAPDAVKRSRPAISITVQQNRSTAAPTPVNRAPSPVADRAVLPESNPVPGTPGATSLVASHAPIGSHDKCTRAKNGGIPPWCADPAGGFSSAAHSAEGSFHTLRRAETTAETGRSLAGLGSAARSQRD